MSRMIHHADGFEDEGTPEPWKVYGPNESDPQNLMYAPPYIVMCEDIDSNTVTEGGKELVCVAAFCSSEKDALLIAAAPELLAACKKALAFFRGDYPGLPPVMETDAALVAAIAKAGGAA